MTMTLTSLRIAQKSTYHGGELWEWSVWLEGTEAELDQVKSVTYVLHPTFQRPVRTISTRENKFRLDAGGWGGFVIHARVLALDGATQHLQHELELYYPDGSATTA